MSKSRQEPERCENSKLMETLALSNACGMSLAKIDRALQLYGLPKHERQIIVKMVRQFGIDVLRTH